MDKRGVFFTLIAVLIVAVLLVAFLPRETFKYESKVPVLKSRVNYANTYVKDLDAYVEQSLRVAGFSALAALSELIKQTPGSDVAYLTEEQLHKYFGELVLHGKYCDKATPCTVESDWKTVSSGGNNLMAGKYLVGLGASPDGRLYKIKESSSDFLHIKVDFGDSSDFDVVLFQSNYSGPFAVGVNLTLSYTVDAGIVSWSRAKTIQTRVGIEGIYDPLYYAGLTGSKAPDEDWYLEVHQTDYPDFEPANEKDVTKLYNHIDKRNYNYNVDAPSFLQRFYRDFSPSLCCGIESPINPNAMSNFQSLVPPAGKVYVDWCVYSNRCDGNKLWYVSYVTGSSPDHYPDFRLDTAHASNRVYNVVKCLYDDDTNDPGCSIS